MTLIFNANTLEDLKQEIVSFLQREAERITSVKKRTPHETAHKQLDFGARAFMLAAQDIAKAKIEPAVIDAKYPEVQS